MQAVSGAARRNGMGDIPVTDVILFPETSSGEFSMTPQNIFGYREPGFQEALTTFPRERRLLQALTIFSLVKSFKKPRISAGSRFTNTTFFCRRRGIAQRGEPASSALQNAPAAAGAGRGLIP
jgi:hypothetical protein